MANLMNMPVKKGILGAFDYKDYISKTNEWENQYDKNLNLLIENAEVCEKKNNSVYLGCSDYGNTTSVDRLYPIMYTQPFCTSKFTLYTIYKCALSSVWAGGESTGDCPDPFIMLWGKKHNNGQERIMIGRWEGDDHYWIGGHYDYVASNQGSWGQGWWLNDRDENNEFKYPLSVYRVFAFSYDGEKGVGKAYINGELIVSMDFRPEPFYLKEINRLGIHTNYMNAYFSLDKPWHSMGLKKYPLNFKHISFFNEIHSDAEVTLNSNWLGKIYKVAPITNLSIQASEDSAIAAVLAKNKVFDEDFAGIIAAWEDGLKDKENNDGDLNEKVNTNKFPISFRDPDDPNAKDDEIGWNPTISPGVGTGQGGHFILSVEDTATTEPVIIIRPATIYASPIGGTLIQENFFVCSLYNSKGELVKEYSITPQIKTTYTFYGGEDRIYKQQFFTVKQIYKDRIEFNSITYYFLSTKSNLFGGVYLSEEDIPDPTKEVFTWRFPIELDSFTTYIS